MAENRSNELKPELIRLGTTAIITIFIMASLLIIEQNTSYFTNTFSSLMANSDQLPQDQPAQIELPPIELESIQLPESIE